MGHEGINKERVTAWFSEHVDGVEPPLRFDLIAGGHSNLTFKVTDHSGDEYVLRRPPLHHVLATAHDMTREYRVITALWDTPVPVPRTYGLCTDGEVNGADFYVMSFVHGVVLHDAATARSALTDETRRSTGESFIDVLADLHAVDIDAVGLHDFARKEGYIERQLKRWHSQWEQSKTRELPEIDDVHALLSERVPGYERASIVHGDYRLGNCITDPEKGCISAVLDWEICTLGDPLADLGYLLAYWPEAGEPDVSSPTAPSALPGFPGRGEMIARYAARSGRDVSLIDFYIAFSLWKLACISEGVYARYLGGAMGSAQSSDQGQFDMFKLQVERLARRAAEAAARLG